MRMKDPDTDQLVMLPDHVQDSADILNIAEMHGVIYAAFNGMQQQFGTFPGGIYQHIVLTPDVEGSIYEYTGDKQGDGGDYDAGCQAFKHRCCLRDASEGH